MSRVLRNYRFDEVSLDQAVVRDNLELQFDTDYDLDDVGLDRDDFDPGHEFHTIDPLELLLKLEEKENIDVI